MARGYLGLSDGEFWWEFTPLQVAEMILAWKDAERQKAIFLAQIFGSVPGEPPKKQDFRSGFSAFKRAYG